MNILEMKLSELLPYERNPRKNDEAVKYVKASIEEFGFKVPIVVDNNNVIVAGHTRYKAAKELKLETVPVIVADDLTEEQVKAFRLADNKVSEKAEWDMPLLETELEDIFSLDMSDFGFLDEQGSIDWAGVEDLTEHTYEQPEHEMLECPFCHHVDRKIHFKKVEGVADENQNSED